MSRTWALRPGEYVQGPRVVSTTLRPVRPAVLIPDDDPGMAARFAQSRSLAWGGHTCYALPFSRSEGLREPWRRLLDLLDPDQVYALGISRPRGNSGVVNMHAPRREPPRPLVDRMGDGLGRLLYTAQEGPERLFTGTSTLLHSVLRAVGKDLKPPDGEGFVVVPRVQRGYSSSPYLPAVARYGGVDDAEVERYLNGVHSHRWRFDLDLSESVRIEEVGGAGDLLGVLAGDLGGLFEGEEEEHALTLPELTLRGLQIECRGTPYGASHRPTGAIEDSRYGPIVVTGSDDSVEDFALFWTLRSELHFASPFPLWIPIDLLESAEAPAVIDAALGRVRPSVMEASPRKDDVLIVSASMDTADLRERLGGRYPEARIGAEDLVGLFTATCEYYYAKEKLPAHFDRGRASIQPPRPEELKRNLMPQVDYVAYEVDVDGMWLPQSKAMAWHLGWPDFHFRDKASKRGNLRFVKQFEQAALRERPARPAHARRLDPDPLRLRGARLRCRAHRQEQDGLGTTGAAWRRREPQGRGEQQDARPAQGAQRRTRPGEGLRVRPEDRTARILRSRVGQGGRTGPPALADRPQAPVPRGRHKVPAVRTEPVVRGRPRR